MALKKEKHTELRPKYDPNHGIRANRFQHTQTEYQITAQINKKDIKLFNISETGLAFQIEKSVDVGQKIGPVEIFLNGEAFFESEVLVKRVQKNDIGFEVGCSFYGKSMREDALISLSLISDTLRKFQASMLEFVTLPDAFINLVARTEKFLEELKSTIDDLEFKLTASSVESKTSFEVAVESLISPRVTERMLDFSAHLHALVQAMDPDMKSRAGDYVRSRLNKYLYVAPFVFRSQSKPLGYAGDYEMMNQIYRNQFEGTSLFAKIIHKTAINEVSSRAVRFRKDFFQEKFFEALQRKEFVTVGALASGPAREVVEFLQKAEPELIKRIRFVLIDQDIEALLNSKRNIQRSLLKSEMMADICFEPVSVKGILERGQESERLKKYEFDLIYTAGLYDYLPEMIAKRLTKHLTQMLSRGGRLIVGNFTIDNPTITISEFILEWTLILRSEKEMIDILSSDSLKVIQSHFDKSRTELLLELEKVE